MKIKICGLTRQQDIEYANRYRPDYIGFVFADGSRRKLLPSAAADLKNRLSENILSVGVFVNQDDDMIIGLCNNGIIDVIQLHGDEDAERIKRMQEKTGKPVIKAVRVRSTEQIAEAEKLPCEYLLLDSFSEHQYGGSGTRFNADLIPKMHKPFFMAGGIQAKNIDGIKQYHPFAVDISSGVETEGLKDEKKIAEMIALVRKDD